MGFSWSHLRMMQVQRGGSSSSGSAPGEFIAPPRSQGKDVVMDSVDVDIPMSDGAHATATASIPSPRSVTGTKRGRDGAEDIDEGVVAKVLAVTFGGHKRGRSNSNGRRSMEKATRS